MAARGVFVSVKARARGAPWGFCSGPGPCPWRPVGFFEGVCRARDAGMARRGPVHHEFGVERMILVCT